MHSPIISCNPLSRTSPSSNLSILRAIRAGEMFMEADNGAPSGGAPSAPSQNPPAEPNAAEAHRNFERAVEKSVQSVLNSSRVGGDTSKALEVLAGQVHTEQQRAVAAEKKLPPQADLDELAAWRTIAQEQGWARPEDAKTKYLQAQREAGEAASIKREQSMKEAVTAAGFDFADFSTRKGVDDVAYEIKDEQVNGKTVKVAYVNWEQDDKTQSKPLSEWVSEKFPTLAKVEAQATQVAPTFGAPVFPMHSGSGAPASTEEAARKSQGGLYQMS